MITLSRNRPVRGSTCQRCRIIRSFITFVIMLGIFSLVVDDSARILQLVTPERAAGTIWIAGSVLFLAKLVAWLRERYVEKLAPITHQSNSKPLIREKPPISMSSKKIH